MNTQIKYAYIVEGTDISILEADSFEKNIFEKQFDKVNNHIISKLENIEIQISENASKAKIVGDRKRYMDLKEQLRKIKLAKKTVREMKYEDNKAVAISNLIMNVLSILNIFAVMAGFTLVLGFGAAPLPIGVGLVVILVLLAAAASVALKHHALYLRKIDEEAFKRDTRKIIKKAEEKAKKLVDKGSRTYP